MSYNPPPYGNPPDYYAPDYWPPAYDEGESSEPYYITTTVMMPVQTTAVSGQFDVVTEEQYEQPVQVRRVKRNVKSKVRYVTQTQGGQVTNIVTQQPEVTNLFGQPQNVTNIVTRQPEVVNYIMQPQKVTNYVTQPTVTKVVNVVQSPPNVEWIATSAYTAQNQLTGKAVMAGKECMGYGAGHTMWAMRTYFNGELVIGKLSLRQKIATVALNGKVINVDDIEVLCGKPEKLKWEAASDGDVPLGAVPGGMINGETLYVGRATYNLSKIPGQVHPSRRCCLIVQGGAEMAMKNYEVLTVV